jgi:predicted metal-binding protein
MKKAEDFQFLEKVALELGAGSAKVIPAEQIVVEDRVRMRCTVGCPSYGACLKCPPFVQTPDEFRKVLKEYRFAMVVKHKPPVMSKEVIGYDIHDREKAMELKAKLWPEIHAYYQKTLNIMLELEKTAFAHGHVFALTFYGGHCMLCETCNVEKGICLNPTMARIAAEAVGVNVVKTAENAGMTVKFSMEVKAPEPMAILLID